MSNTPKAFFAGQEEVFARLASLILNCLFFTIFIVTRGFITLQWTEMLVVLGLFWFLYELFAISLFQMFVFFSSNQKVQDPTVQTIATQAQPTENQEISQNTNQ